MLKISTKASTTLSLIFSGVLLVALGVMYFLVPAIVSKASLLIYPPRPITTLGSVYLCVVGYLVLIFATVADVLLFLLLLRVRKSLVFSERSIAYIRYISWLAMLEGVLFLALAPYVKISVFVFVAALMLGLALRVVKNVLEEAMLIKNENDFTI